MGKQKLSYKLPRSEAKRCEAMRCETKRNEAKRSEAMKQFTSQAARGSQQLNARGEARQDANKKRQFAN